MFLMYVQLNCVHIQACNLLHASSKLTWHSSSTLTENKLHAPSYKIVSLEVYGSIGTICMLIAIRSDLSRNACGFSAYTSVLLGYDEKYIYTSLAFAHDPFGQLHCSWLQKYLAQQHNISATWPSLGAVCVCEQTTGELFIHTLVAQFSIKNDKWQVRGCQQSVGAPQVLYTAPLVKSVAGDVTVSVH